MSFKPILGINFYVGDIGGLLRLGKSGGLIVVPAAPALANLPSEPNYRDALEGSDFAITDSGFMVLLWFLFKRERMHRISGLKYLRALLDEPDFLAGGASFWVMPNRSEAEANLKWLRTRGLAVPVEDTYVAPNYSKGAIEDRALLDILERRKPRYVVLNLGGGVQERLGFFLKQRLTYRATIVCTGAAIAFLSGQQANIPPWVDHLYLGWAMRCARNPSRFLPRYWHALRLVPLLWKHGAQSVAPSTNAARTRTSS